MLNGKYAFSFRGNGSPKKIEIYGNFIFYMTDRTFAVYDKRKGEVIGEVGVKEEQRYRSGDGLERLKEFGRFSEQVVNDFLLEPNLGRIYLSLTNELRVLEFSFF